MKPLLNIILFTISICSASIIDLQTDPQRIKPLLTKAMTLTCYLNDTGSIAGGSVIGRRDVQRSVDAERRLTTRDVTSTVEDMDFVTTILILSSTGEPLASITEHTPAHLLVTNITNAKVAGSITDKDGMRGFLQMTIPYPSEGEAGQYQCEVNTINSKGHSVMFKTAVEVEALSPSINDLVLYAREIEKEKDDLAKRMQLAESAEASAKQRLATLEADDKTAKQRLATLETDNNSAKQRLTTLEKDDATAKSQIAALNTYTRKAPRLVSCAWSPWVNDWDNDANWHAPAGALMVGMHSYHNNHHEDRRFQFYYCFLHAP